MMQSSGRLETDVSHGTVSNYDLRFARLSRCPLPSGSQKLIANELLAFIQHAIDTMDEVTIVQICKSNFMEEEKVCSGKALPDAPDTVPSKGCPREKSLQDFITLFKETNPDNVPAIVLKQLHKLPPVTFDHVYMTRFLNDITSFNASLHSKLEASNNTYQCATYLIIVTIYVII